MLAPDPSKPHNLYNNIPEGQSKMSKNGPESDNRSEYYTNTTELHDYNTLGGGTAMTSKLNMTNFGDQGQKVSPFA